MNQNLPWVEIMGMRNRLVHGYDKINYITVYEVVEFELTPLKYEVAKLIEMLSQE